MPVHRHCNAAGRDELDISGRDVQWQVSAVRGAIDSEPASSVIDSN